MTDFDALAAKARAGDPDFTERERYDQGLLPACRAQIFDRWSCTRPRGHRSNHVARAGVKIVAVWPSKEVAS